MGLIRVFRYKTVFPSHVLEGGKGKIGCRICHPAMDRFAMADSCSFGWGGMITIAVCLAWALIVY